MCGIFGMIGQNAVSNTLRALKYLEYRGYDSAGIALRRNDGIQVYKTEGRIAALERLTENVQEANMAIGHTRWATHGKVCTANAHPFLSADGKFAIVHNGIIENYAELREGLGDVFSSDTDSETVAHLLQHNYQGNMLEAMLDTAHMLRGSYAIAVLSVYECKLYAVKHKSPLVVGVSDSGVYLCSDIRCASHWAESVAVTPDDTVVEVSPDGVHFYDMTGSERQVPFFRPEQAETDSSGGDLMYREILEIPDRLRRAKEYYFRQGGLTLTEREVVGLRRIYLIGCGTAYHSGLQSATVARNWLDIDLLPVIASEFLYGHYPVDEDTLAILISQSGETADTIRAAERVTEMGGMTYAVTNTDSSSLTFACARRINICAGAEYAVASTKAYNCQLLTLILLLMDIGVLRGTLDRSVYDRTVADMDALPRAIEEVLALRDKIAAIATRLKDCTAVFYIGRDADYPTACEGSLKLKEISYIHSEAYPAGELKHGTLALMDPTVAVVAVSCGTALHDKTASSVTEVHSRGAWTLSVSDRTFAGAEPIILPEIHPYLYGIVSVVPLQLLAYYTARALGRDVDKPRHLAKSVTVE